MLDNEIDIRALEKAHILGQQQQISSHFSYQNTPIILLTTDIMERGVDIRVDGKNTIAEKNNKRINKKRFMSFHTHTHTTYNALIDLMLTISPENNACSANQNKMIKQSRLIYDFPKKPGNVTGITMTSKLSY